MIKTSEFVQRGHPDKICDQIVDYLLDKYLEKDNKSRVALEALIKDNKIVIAGEVTSNADINIRNEVRKALKDIGLNTKGLKIDVFISEQSKDIKDGVDKDGAGDQGIVYGYSTNETKEKLPLTYVLLRELTQKIDELVRRNTLYFNIDGKSQLSIEYENRKPKSITSLVISVQTNEGVKRDDYEKVIYRVIQEVIPKDLLSEDTKILINPSGNFVKGGAYADSGVTGRKLQVDTYGTIARHGGGAFSGKDYTKTDRSGAYYARFIANHIIEAELASSVEVIITYAIGIDRPLSIEVAAENSQFFNEELTDAVNKTFNFTNSEVVKLLQLDKIKYYPLSQYGHFGYSEYPYERIDEDLLNKLKEEIYGKNTETAESL